MAQVSDALRSLSGTMARRGNIGEARLRGADANLEMKRLDYGLTRQKELDALQRPGLELAASKAAHQSEKVGLNLNMFMGQGTMDKIHQVTPDKYGKAPVDYYSDALPGSIFDPKTGERKNADGTPTTVERWKLEKDIMPGITMMNISLIDPVKKMNDALWEKEESLKGLPKGSEEYNQVQQGLNDVKSTMSDNTKMATLYARQGALVSEYLAKAYAKGMNPNMISFLKERLARSEKKLA